MYGGAWQATAHGVTQSWTRLSDITFFQYTCIKLPGGSERKASASHAEDLHSIPGSRRSPGDGNGNLLQYSCLENPVDRGAW